MTVVYDCKTFFYYYTLNMDTKLSMAYLVVCRTHDWKVMDLSPPTGKT